MSGSILVERMTFQDQHLPTRGKKNSIFTQNTHKPDFHLFSKTTLHKSQPPTPTALAGPVQLSAHSLGHSRHSPSVALL